MIFIEALSITIMTVIGLLCAITDIKTGIVPNRYLLYGFIGGLSCHIAYLILGMAPYYSTWLLCMLIADAFAFAMFCGRLWAAGDAKLFMTLFFLTPPILFDSGQLSNSVTPYIFIFAPSLIWVLVDSIIRLTKKEPRKKQIFDFKEWVCGCIKTIIEVTALHKLVFTLFPAWSINNNLLLFSCIMAYAYFCGNYKPMQSWLAVLLHGLVLVAIWIAKGWNFDLPDIRGYLVLLAVMIVQRVAGMYNYQQIATSRASVGMIPAAETVLLMKPSRIQFLPTDPSEQLDAKMNEKQAEAVRKWGLSTKGKSEIWIVRKVPFAFMITVGFAIWTVLRIVG